MVEARKPYMPDRRVAAASFAVGLLGLLFIPDPESDVWSVVIGLGLGGVIDFGVWRGRGCAFALNLLLGGIGTVFLYFEGVRHPLSWPFEVLPTLALVAYSVVRLTGRVGPPPTGWRPYAPLGGRIDSQSTPLDT
ncbi:hypothetical protein EON82_12890 [bacterium]|nr:MAG: hypothetical protein EON82_12890 [bacterium]